MTTTKWQKLIRDWHLKVFGSWDEMDIGHGAKVYSMRLLEEALELAQAENVSIEDIATIVKQVYTKPAGETYKEFGGVLITATGYANQANLSMESVFQTEYAWIQEPKLIQKIRYRNYHGDKIGLKK